MSETSIPDAATEHEIPPCLGVVIPVHNEAKTLAEVLTRVLAQSSVAEVIAVDDASRDASGQILEDFATRDTRLRLHRHPQNRGKSAALRSGFALCTAPIVVVQDADLEYDPAEYPRLLHPILRDEADVVYGSRFLQPPPGSANDAWHTTANRMLTGLSNLTTNLRLTDMETCYKMFRRELIQNIPLRENRFGFEPEITAKLSRLPVRIREVPISYRRRGYAEGKQIGWRDGISAVRCIFQYRYFGRPPETAWPAQPAPLDPPDTPDFPSAP